MPNIKSAKKRMKQNLKRRERNRKVKATLRTFIKRAELAIEEGEDKDKAHAALMAATRKLDTTAQKKIIHSNMAGRKKSRLMKKFNARFA